MAPGFRSWRQLARVSGDIRSQWGPTRRGVRVPLAAVGLGAEIQRPGARRAPLSRARCSRRSCAKAEGAKPAPQAQVSSHSHGKWTCQGSRRHDQPGRGKAPVMPFTVQHAEHGRLDATQPDLGCGVTWEAIHRARAPLSCASCEGQMVARKSVLGLRHFAHRRRTPDCPMAGESVGHLLLKSDLAAAGPAADWDVLLEAAASHGAWRADVLAVAPDGGRRYALEAQLSPITEDSWIANRRGYGWNGSPRIRSRGWSVSCRHASLKRLRESGAGDEVQSRFGSRFLFASSR